MQDKLTKTVIDKAAAVDGKDLWIWDTKTTGFGLRVRPNGRKVYVVEYRPGEGGRATTKRRYTIGQHGSPWTVDTARTEAKRVLALVEQGEDPAAEKQAGKKAETMDELCKRFLTDHAEAKRKSRTADEYRRLIDRIITPAMGKRKAKDITRQDVAKLHHQYRATPYQANRVLAVLSKLFNLAEAWGIRPDGTNPCRHVEKFTESKRERMLSADELSALGDALRSAELVWAKGQEIDRQLIAAREAKDRPLCAERRADRKALGDLVSSAAVAAIRLLVFTGARMTEVLTLKWEWVNVERGEARLPDSKTGAKTLHLPPPALAVLEALTPEKGNPFIIVGQKAGAHLTDLEKPWQAIRQAAGLGDVRLHDLRHAFASVAASSGMGLPIIGKMLGHTQAQTTARYAHLASDPVKAAAASVAGKIAAAMEGKPFAEVVELPKRKV